MLGTGFGLRLLRGRDNLLERALQGSVVACADFLGGFDESLRLFRIIVRRFLLAWHEKTISHFFGFAEGHPPTIMMPSPRCSDVVSTRLSSGISSYGVFIDCLGFSDFFFAKYFALCFAMIVFRSGSSLFLFFSSGDNQCGRLLSSSCSRMLNSFIGCSGTAPSGNSGNSANKSSQYVSQFG